MATPILQFKRGAFANLPGLRAGEPALTSDTFDLYVGIDSTTNGNKFFGSHNYWTRQTATTGSGIRFLERTDGGSNYIELKAPDTALAGNVTYNLPGTQGGASSVLTNDGSGNLSWSSGSASPVFSGIATFQDTTDNTLGNSNTGSVQIDGGLGVDKNVTIGANLYVGGYSEFIGVATFRGGTINLGDGNTDNINVGGEFVSGLAPNVDNTYDIGISTQRWRDAYFAGIGSFAAGAYIDNVQIGITGTNIIDTVSGDLTLSSASGLTIIDDNLSVTGVTTFNQPLVGTIGTATRAVTVDITDTDVQSGGIVFGSVGTGSTLYNDTDLTYNSNTNVLSVPTISVTTEVRTGTIKAADTTSSITISNTTGAVQTNSDLTVGGNLYVSGSTTQVNTDTLTVEDRTIELGRVIAGQPTTTTWDLAVLFNYGDAGTARKSGLVWEASGATKRFQFTTDVSTGADGGPADTNLPAFTVANFAPIEILELWLNDTTGSSVVASYLAADGLFTGSAAGRYLQNITVDAGTF